MTQNDLDIANQTFPAFRADLNSALETLATQSAAEDAPNPPRPNQFWYQPSSGLMRMRNNDNTGWRTLFDFSGSSTINRGRLAADSGSAAAPSVGFAGDTGQGLYRTPGAVGMAVDGSGVFTWAGAQVRALVEFLGTTIRAAQFRAAVTDSKESPGHSWDTDTNTGMYRFAANTIAFATAAVTRLIIGPNSITTRVPLWSQGGTAAAPSLSFDEARESGFYPDGDNVKLSIDGKYVLGFTQGLINAQSGVKFSGDGSELSVLNADAVLECMAGLTLGGRGTPAFLARKTDGDLSAGTIYAGSSLVYASVHSDVSKSSVSPSGSWRCLGGSVDGVGRQVASLFVRI